ncbi:hypothetical protein GOBAR_AA36766 [Gossypium barbadense]|uniref:Uncharacterized protein n=1 Tax=Gossypium barbadense TaxID=3634 RepID=A0A2P5VYQ9_GOSBA|nr:hypothetical protein GOBAR_AA36766 [Gossypium barbadense]
MLSKFISVSETHFQNTETALKNQQASIQGLETQIGQLSKLISERLQGSLPSNTEPNPREQLNAINVQDEEGFVEPEPEPRQETVVSKGQGEVGYNKNKTVNVEYKPRVPCPNATRKDRLDEQFGDEAITFQARNSGNTMEIEGDRLNHSTKTDNMIQPTLQEISLKEVHEPFSSNSRGPIHDDRRLQIEGLDEWRTHKPRTHDKPKLRQNELDTSPNQLKVGDKVLLDVVDPHIVTTTPNEEIPLTVLSIFPFGTVEVSHLKFGTFKGHGQEHEPVWGSVKTGQQFFPNTGCDKISRPYDIAVSLLTTAIRALLTTDPWELFFGIIKQTFLELTMELCSTFYLQTVMTSYDDPGTIQFRLGGLVRQLSVLEFGAALGLYTEELKKENELHALTRHIHFSPSKCWHTLAPGAASYNPSHSKASVLPPSLRYLHAILAHTITGR